MLQGAHVDVVNAVRRADWIDATMGTVHQGTSRRCTTPSQSMVSTIPCETWVPGCTVPM